ncbi:MAG: hypothetical protein QMC38_01080, partial [Sinobacterium sp.]
MQNTLQLTKTCTTFSYVGQYVPFSQDLIYVVTAKNAKGTTASNYGGNNATDVNDDWWELSLEYNHIVPTDNNGNDGKLFGVMNTTNTENYDGSATYTLTRPAGTDFDDYSTPLVRTLKTATQLSEFSAEFSLSLSNKTLTGVSTVADENDVCYQTNYPEGCIELPAKNISGTEMRYGRLSLESTYGPETEPLNVPIKAEYFKNNQWLLNTDDNCTSIAFDLSAGQLLLNGEATLKGLVGNISSIGELLGGKSVGSQLRFAAP